MTSNIGELLAQRDALDAQISAVRREERNSAIARVRELMQQHGLTTTDLQTATKTKERSKVAAKYRDPSTGTTWSGRGLRPKWLAAALAAGKSLADFVI